MLPDKMFISLITTDLRDKIATATLNDELATKIRECLHKQLLPPMCTAFVMVTDHFYNALVQMDRVMV